jgi:KDO2-lipid IV(A) lauroyltransferase
MLTLFRALSVFAAVAAACGGLGAGLGGLPGLAHLPPPLSARQCGAGRLLAWQVRAAVAMRASMVAELPRLWFGAPVPMRLGRRQWIEQAHAPGRGIVFLTPHLGCFEITAQGYARALAPARPHHRAVPARAQGLAARGGGGARNRPGLATAPTTLSGVRQMIKALKKGEAVGLLPDQVPPEAWACGRPFLAATPTP